MFLVDFGRCKREDRPIPRAAICALSISAARGVTHTPTDTQAETLLHPLIK